MKKKTIILSKEQINEIVGGNGWDATINAQGETVANNGGTEVSAEGHTSIDYGEPKKTDDISNDLTCDLFGPWRHSGINGAIYSLREWKKKRLNEDVVNQNFVGRKTTLSPTAVKNIGNNISQNSVAGRMIKNGVDVSRLPDVKHDLKDAIAKAKNGDSSTLDNMGGLAAANEISKLYDKEKNMSKRINDTKPEGQKIKSAPKTSGNGKAHSPKKGGTITFS